VARSLLQKVAGRCRRFGLRARDLVRSLHSVREYRHAVVNLRRLYYCYVARALKTVDSDLAFGKTLAHNLPSLKWSNSRIELLLRPLSVIETLRPDSDLLIIGPRNKHDLFTAQGYGFAPERIRGLDLISYSPRIDLGDMHAAPYPDDSFDAIVIGWTLSYSRSPAKFADEMIRLIRDMGIIAIGVEYTELSDEDTVALLGYAIEERDAVAERINSSAQILELFSDKVDSVFFNHDAPARRSHTREAFVPDCSNVAVIFSVKKSVRAKRGAAG
jgi:hypothetical protein